VIISDLQHIESATETDVQGGCKRPSCWYGGHGKGKPGEEPEIFDTDTETSTSTNTLIPEDQFSNSEF
jgi:hypothetical protein